MDTNEKTTKDAHNGYPFPDVMPNVKKKYTPSCNSFVFCGEKSFKESILSYTSDNTLIEQKMVKYFPRLFLLPCITTVKEIVSFNSILSENS